MNQTYDADDVIALQFKSMFFGMSQSTSAGSQSQPPPVVLAEDSEED